MQTLKRLHGWTNTHVCHDVSEETMTNFFMGSNDSDSGVLQGGSTNSVSIMREPWGAWGAWGSHHT